jgi:hypothetical protein
MHDGHRGQQLGSTPNRSESTSVERAFRTHRGQFTARLYSPGAQSEVASLARTSRMPALEELFYLGNHPGTFNFEIGNPALEPEHAFGFDLSMRWRIPAPRARLRVSETTLGISSSAVRSV